MVKVVAFLRLIRWPNLLIIAFTQFMVLTFLIGKGHEPMEWLGDYPFYFIVVSTLMIAAGGYIINDYYDVKIDSVNKPDEVIIDRLLRRRWVLGAQLFLNVSGIAIGILLNKWIGIIHLLSSFSLWVYSNRLKCMPIIGNIFISLLTSASFIILLLYYPYNIRLVLTFAVYAFFISLIREIIKDIQDRKGDKFHGCHTFPAIYGVAKSKYIIISVVAIFIPTLFILANPLSNYMHYFFIGLQAPVAYLVYRLVYADRTTHFALLSQYCKLLMLIGVLSMALV